MKRWLSILLAVLALMTMTACGDSGEGEKTESKRPSMDPSEYVAPAPLVYTELPQSLKAEKVGSFTGEVKTADGGLYYQEGEKYGIMTLDGMVDSGPIYAICQPQKQYFAVSKTVGDSANATSLNVVGLVDALGREVIPQELVDKMVKAGKYGQGFATVEYLAASYLDMDYHVLTEIPADLDVEKFEAKVLGDRGILPQIPSRYRSTYFNHTFNGGYTAGYYSYIWAEVLDADAYDAFVETGDIFNQEVANKYRTEILERAGEEDAMNLYINFRGKEPGIDPLLKNRGLK